MFQKIAIKIFVSIFMIFNPFAPTVSTSGYIRHGINYEGVKEFSWNLCGIEYNLKSGTFSSRILEYRYEHICNEIYDII